MQKTASSLAAKSRSFRNWNINRFRRKSEENTVPAKGVEQKWIFNMTNI